MVQRALPALFSTLHADSSLQAINYLLARPEVAGAPVASRSGPDTPGRQRMRSDGVYETPVGSRSNLLYTHGSVSESRLTPKGSRHGKTPTSTYKRTGTAAEEFERQSLFGSPRSLRTFSDFIGANDSVEFIDRNEIPSDLGHDDEDNWEGLENVRACCDGKHDGGSSRFFPVLSHRC